LGTLGCCRRKCTYISWCARWEKKSDVTRRENETETHQNLFLADGGWDFIISHPFLEDKRRKNFFTPGNEK